MNNDWKKIDLLVHRIEKPIFLDSVFVQDENPGRLFRIDGIHLNLPPETTMSFAIHPPLPTSGRIFGVTVFAF
jgi:hypothetical protein